MAITITDNNIINRCKMLSAFEGKALVDGNGESRYKDIRLTSLEDNLVAAYILQGKNEVMGVLEGAIELQDAINDSDKISKLNASIEETLSAYVMYRWLWDKVADRSAAYKTLFDNMLEATRRMAWKKKRPTMTEINTDNGSSSSGGDNTSSGGDNTSSGEDSGWSGTVPPRFDY